MGGLGSGRPGSRSTVESGLTLDIGYMQRKGLLEPYRSGSLEWSRSNGGEKHHIASIGYSLDEDGTLLRLRYTKGSGENAEALNYSVVLLKTPAHFGGFRYWFLCPLVGCKSGKLSKLYLPSGGKYFGCRKCYKLTYTSSNESHSMDRVFRDIAKDIGETPDQIKRLFQTERCFKQGRF